MSHVNFKEVASSSAAYSLKDSYDAAVLSTMFSGVSASGPDHVIGADAAAGSAGVGETTASVDLGVASEVDPLDLMARMARLLDDESVPEENRWFVAPPIFYEKVFQAGKKIAEVQVTGDGTSPLRNGLVSLGNIAGFTCYKSTALVSSGGTDQVTVTGLATDGSENIILGGHLSSTATASHIAKTEVVRSTETFSDIVRGLHVFGRKVLRPEAIVGGVVSLD